MSKQVTGDAAVLIVGASGGIGGALVQHYLQAADTTAVIAVSRGHRPPCFETAGKRLLWRISDYTETSIAGELQWASTLGLRIIRVVICNGILHNERIAPEKTTARLKGSVMHEVFQANVVVPSLWVAALPRLLPADAECVVAVLSARVGSISDNRLGGWHSYRASKAALNMVLKSSSVEFARRFPGVKLLAFHPGTTNTELSQPFQRGVPPEKLFTPDFVAGRLASLMDQLKPDGQLAYLAWDGSKIEW
jgi:NAD(P)-dependent dehydrogenase (short-subunit alcohol dehydrogenase family)